MKLGSYYCGSSCAGENREPEHDVHRSLGPNRRPINEYLTHCRLTHGYKSVLVSRAPRNLPTISSSRPPACHTSTTPQQLHGDTGPFRTPSKLSQADPSRPSVPLKNGGSRTAQSGPINPSGPLPSPLHSRPRHPPPHHNPLPAPIPVPPTFAPPRHQFHRILSPLLRDKPSEIWRLSRVVALPADDSPRSDRPWYNVALAGICNCRQLYAPVGCFNDNTSTKRVPSLLSGGRLTLHRLEGPGAKQGLRGQGG